MQKLLTSIPIIGSRKAEQIKDNLACTEFSIPDDVMVELNQASEIELGFPNDFLSGKDGRFVSYGGTRGEIVD